MRDIVLEPFSILNFKAEGNPERRILGHLLYNEIPKDKLVLIEPNVEFHINNMRDSLYKYQRRSEKRWDIFILLEWFQINKSAKRNFLFFKIP